MIPDTEELVRDYLVAKREVIDRGFIDEIVWQMAVHGQRATLAMFVRESAWVILSAGMREAVIRKIFPQIDRVLFGFDPILMVANSARCEDAALQIFNHNRKIRAIFTVASIVCEMSERDLHERLSGDVEGFLCSLPYIGQVTWRHLAKNLGIQVAKPDRHLIRIANATRRPSVDDLCDEIAEWLDEPVSVVDVVLWRWSVIHVGDCLNRCNSSLHEGYSRRPLD